VCFECPISVDLFFYQFRGEFSPPTFIESKVKDHIYKVLLGIPRQRYRWEGGVCREAESQVVEAQL
jgi:hypothetical protein